MSDGSLTVLSISREDRGAYTCRAYSIQGEAVHTTRLLVQGRIPTRCLRGCLLCPRGAGGGVTECTVSPWFWELGEGGLP